MSPYLAAIGAEFYFFRGAKPPPSHQLQQVEWGLGSSNSSNSKNFDTIEIFTFSFSFFILIFKILSEMAKNILTILGKIKKT